VSRLAALTVFFLPVSDLDFDLKNIIAALDIVPPKHYMRLAVNLGLKPHDVQISEEDNYRNSGRVLIDIVDLWMRNGIDPKPSWQSLEEALQLTL
jgi:hypothetical protein